MRDCENCEHYVLRDVKFNYSSGGTRDAEDTKIYGCELWECDKDEKEYDDFDRSGEEWR